MKISVNEYDFKENTLHCFICKIPPSIWLPNRQKTKDHLSSNKSFYVCDILFETNIKKHPGCG